VCWITTPFVMSIAVKLGAVDQPGGRRVHLNPTPRGGGIAVFFGTHAAMVLAFLLFPELPRAALNESWWWIFFIVSSFLLLVGIMDDIYQVGARYKLGGQVSAALLLYCSGIQFQGVLGIEFPWLLDCIVTVVWIVLIVNAFNLIDGYDGLASGLAAIAALGIAATLIYRHLPLEALLLVGFIGACIGFLKYNIHPAAVFLGDTGSMFLGLVLATVTLSTASKGTAVAAILVPLLALGIPIFDTMLAVWRRIARSLLAYLKSEEILGGIMSADTEHIHHRLARKIGIRPRDVTATLYLANALLVFVGVIALIFHDAALGIFLAVGAVVIFVVIRYVARVELRDSGLIIIHSLREESHPNVTWAMFMVLDMVLFVGALLAARWLIELPLPRLVRVQDPTLPLGCLVGMLPLVLANPYKAVIQRQIKLVRGDSVLAITGVLTTLYGIVLLHRPEAALDAIYGVLFIGIWLSSAGIFRLFPEILAEYFNKKSERSEE